MNFNFGEVLSRAWKITWKHKILWAAGFAMMLVAFLIFPIMLAPMFALFTSKDPSQLFESPLLWSVMCGGFLLSIVLSYGIGSLIRPMITAGALKAERGAERLSFRELFSDGFSFFWRFLGLMLLFALAFILMSFITSGIQVVGSILTLGLASLCLWPLSFLIYPLMYAGLILLEFAEAAIVADGLSVMDALQRGWDVMRSNKMNVFVMAVIMYMGLGMISTMAIFPIIFPMMFVPAFMADNSLPREYLWVLGICSAAFFPIMAFVQGIIIVLTKTGWTLTYLHLTQKPVSSVALESTQPA